MTVNCQLQNNVYNLIGEINDVIEENEINEIPSFFIHRIYECDFNVIKDFVWYVKMMNLYCTQLDLKKYRDCQQTIKELESRLGYYPVFHELENNIINQSRKATFIYNGRDDVTWDELPIEIRKHDYPYYFNKAGEDCYPYCTDIHDMD